MLSPPREGKPPSRAECYDDRDVDEASMTQTAAQRSEPGIVPHFGAPYAPPDEALAPALLAAAARDGAADARIDARAGRLIRSIRARAGGLGGIDDLLHA